MNDVKDRIVRAYKTLLRNDFHLLAVNANERSITHKFAEYLQLEFPEYHVDCEYNRKGMDGKKLDGLIQKIGKKVDPDDSNGKTVYPDIIIHHRGTNDNFIVIEAKKSSNNTDYDKEKLSLYKKELKYIKAFLVIFPVEDDLEKTVNAAVDNIKEIS